MICEKCGKEYEIDFRKSRKSRKTKSRFCSMGCSKSRTRSENTRKKVSISLKQRYMSVGKKKANKVNKKCEICGIDFEGTVRKRCCSKKCSQKFKNSGVGVSDWRKKLKLKLVAYKGGSCEICGFNKHPAALQFHHRNPEEKEFQIGGKGITKSLSRCIKEVDKCALLCANCHAIIHCETLL